MWQAYMRSAYFSSKEEAMELDYYRNFIAIVEFGSLTAAAEQVHLAQPALSKQLRTLEAHFNTKLLLTRRGSKNLVITDAGRSLYRKAKRMCALDDQVLEEINDIGGGTKGELRISVANSRAALLINSVLRKFHALYPQINYRLYEAAISEQVQQLLTGVTELGIMTLPLRRHQDNFDILFRRAEAISAVFHEESPFVPEKDSECRLDIVAQMPLTVSAGVNTILRPYFEEKNLKPRILCVSTNKGTALEWVRSRHAIGIIPTEPGEYLGEGLIVRPLVDIPQDYYNTIVKLRGQPLSALAGNFLKFYAAACDAEPVCDLDMLIRKGAKGL